MSYTLRIKNKPNWLIVIFLGMWLVGLLSIMLVILIGLVDKPMRLDAEIIIFFLIATVAWLFFFKIFLWNIRGAERIEISEDGITIFKEGTILTLTKKFEIENVNRFYLSTKRESLFSKTYRIGGGKIILDYLENKIHFGQMLTLVEANALINELNEELKKAKSNK